MQNIDAGKIRPSRALADSLADLLSKRQEFVLLDEQKVAFESSMSAMRQTKANAKEKNQGVFLHRELWQSEQGHPL